MTTKKSNFTNIEEMQKEKAAWVAQTKKLNNFNGIKNTLTKLYTSSGHFIFELLQNAEDVYANSVKFRLYKDKLIFEHNGTRDFDINDIDSITNIEDSTKEDNGNSIGKFGIGFKSVFEYTSTPEIHSGNYHFIIEDLFIPKVVAPLSDDNKSETIIILPFNGEKNKEECYKEIIDSLLQLNSDILLFLRNITEIKCLINSKTILIKRENSYKGEKSPSNICRISKFDNNILKEEFFYKRFFKTITLIGDDYIEKDINIGIAFLVDHTNDNNTWKIKPIFKKDSDIPNGKVFAYFPCKAEEQRLCFHIHAPFALTVDREKLRDDGVNKLVISEIGNLICESIKDLKENGLVGLELYKTLPNDKDDNDMGKYITIKSKILNYFLNENYILMADGSYQNPKNKFIGFHNIQQLLSNKDISLLFSSNQESYWVKNPMQNRRDYNFLTSLHVREYKIIDFLEKMVELQNRNSKVYQSLVQEFGNRDIEWYIRLYSLMNRAWTEITRNKLQDSIMSLHLCYCNDKKVYPFSSCYLADKVSDLELSTVHCVNTQCLNSNKTEINLIAFFRNLGIREYRIADWVQELCKDFEINKNKSISKIILFFKLYKIDNSLLSILKKHRILCSDNGKWDIPDNFYLPEEFDGSLPNISIYYDFYNSKKTNNSYYYSSSYSEPDFHKLTPEYRTLFKTSEELSDFTEFLIKLGVEKSLPVYISSCKDNPMWSQIQRNAENFFGGNVKETDEDFEVEYLGAFLKRTPNEAVFELICNFLAWTPNRCSICRYSPAQKYTPKQYLSNISVHLCINQWVMQEYNEKICFVKPAEASLSRIPRKYKKLFDNPNLKNWISNMNFGEKERQISEKQKKENEILSAIGFDIGFVDIIRDLQNNGISKLELQEYMLALKDDLQSKIAEGFFSIDDINEDRIRRKSLDNYNDADEIEYEKRIRTIRIGNQQKEMAEIFLRNVCVDSDNTIHCQICKGTMPFKNKNNQDYFEVSQLFSKKLVKKNIKENYVALCPICSAKMKVYYQHNFDKQKDLFYQILNSNEEVTNFHITLDKDEDIMFAKKHILALKEIIKDIANHSPLASQTQKPII